MSTNREDDEYTLGTGDDELGRLEFQHRLWAPVARELWVRAQVGWGHRVLDLGAGPGYAAADLGILVGGGGRVHAVDRSARFIEACRNLASAGKLPIDAFVGELTDGLGGVLGSFEGTYDTVWMRWVLCFVSNPTHVIQEAARALKPGGRIVIQDYFNYRSMRLMPPTTAFQPVVDAIVANWHRTGGNPDVGALAVECLEAQGLELEHTEVLTRIARPRDTLWQWPTSYFTNFLPRLVEEGDLDEAARVSFMDEWNERAASGRGMFQTPPMLGIVARKPL